MRLQLGDDMDYRRKLNVSMDYYGRSIRKANKKDGGLDTIRVCAASRAAKTAFPCHNGRPPLGYTRADRDTFSMRTEKN